MRDSGRPDTASTHVRAGLTQRVRMCASTKHSVYACVCVCASERASERARYEDKMLGAEADNALLWHATRVEAARRRAHATTQR